MNYERQVEIDNEVIRGIQEIRRTKTLEYANKQDVLADFKEVAAETGTTPLQCWSTYVKKHLRAVDAFVREGGVKSESLKDRVIDICVYHIMLLALAEDIATEQDDVDDARKAIEEYNTKGHGLGPDPHFGHAGHSIAEPCIPSCPLYGPPDTRTPLGRQVTRMTQPPDSVSPEDLATARRVIDRVGPPPPGEGTHPLQRHRDSMG